MNNIISQESSSYYKQFENTENLPVTKIFKTIEKEYPNYLLEKESQKISLTDIININFNYLKTINSNYNGVNVKNKDDFPLDKLICYLIYTKSSTFLVDNNGSYDFSISELKNQTGKDIVRTDIYINNEKEDFKNIIGGKPDPDTPTFTEKIDSNTDFKVKTSETDSLLKLPSDKLVTNKDETLLSKNDDTSISNDIDKLVTNIDEALATNNDDTLKLKNDDTLLSKNDDTTISKNDDTTISKNDDTLLSKNDDTSISNDIDKLVTNIDEALATNNGDTSLSKNDDDIKTTTDKDLVATTNNNNYKETNNYQNTDKYIELLIKNDNSDMINYDIINKICILSCQNIFNFFAELIQILIKDVTRNILKNDYILISPTSKSDSNDTPTVSNDKKINLTINENVKLLTIYFDSYLFTSSEFVTVGRVTFQLTINLTENTLNFDFLKIIYNLENIMTEDDKKDKSNTKLEKLTLFNRVNNSLKRKVKRTLNRFSGGRKSKTTKKSNKIKKTKKTIKVKKSNKANKTKKSKKTIKAKKSNKVKKTRKNNKIIK